MPCPPPLLSPPLVFPVLITGVALPAALRFRMHSRQRAAQYADRACAGDDALCWFAPLPPV